MSVLATFHTACGCSCEKIIPEPAPWQYRVPILPPLRASWKDPEEPWRAVRHIIRVFERRKDYVRSSKSCYGRADYYEVVS